MVSFLLVSVLMGDFAEKKSILPKFSHLFA